MKIVFQNLKHHADLIRDEIEIIKLIDNENAKITCNFYIGDDPTAFIIKGRLNIITNSFHQDFENQEDLGKYFEGYPDTIENIIENR